MEVKLKHEVASRGYRHLDLDNGSEVYCKFSHAGQEFLGVKLCRETVPYEVEYYIFFLHLPQKTFFGRFKMLNPRNGNAWIDICEADMEWLNRSHIDALCVRAMESRIEAAYVELEAKLMEDEP